MTAGHRQALHGRRGEDRATMTVTVNTRDDFTLANFSARFLRW